MDRIEDVIVDIGQGIEQPILDSMLGLDAANTLLASVLVRHLIDEGVIDRQKYLESNKKYEEMFSRSILQAGGDEEAARNSMGVIKKVFTTHRDDLERLK